MPRYSFLNDETGRTVELILPMSESVPFGATIKHEGRTLTRVVETQQQSMPKDDVHFTDVQLAPWTPDGPRYDKEGQIQFDSLGETREFCAKRTAAGEHMDFDRTFK